MLGSLFAHRAVTAAIRSSLPTLLAAILVTSSSAAQPSGRVAYLIDFAMQTLDLVDLEHGTTALGLLPVGTVPNQIRISGRVAYVVNSVPENLQVIDLGGPMTTATISLGAGTNPWAVAVAGERAYVSLWGRDAVAVVDLVTAAIIDTIPVGVSPEGMCIAGGELYVANSGFVSFGVYDPGTVSVVDLATHQVTATIGVGLNAQWCAVDGDGEVHVVCSDLFAANNGRVFVLDPATHAATDSLRVGGFPGPIAVSANGIGWMVDYGAGLLAIDTVTHTVLHDITNPVSAGGLGALGLDVSAAERVHVALSADGLLTVIAPDGTLEHAFAVGPGPLDVALYEADPVPVSVVDFAAVRRGRDVVELRWAIAGDEIYGCELERATGDNRDDGFHPLTNGEPGPLLGDRGRYTFVDADAGPGNLIYRLIGVYRDGTREPIGRFPVAVAGAAAPPVPVAGLAMAVHPNPARPPLGVELEIPEGFVPGAVEVEVVLFDVVGRAIRRLDRARHAAGGKVLIEWDGRDQAGRPAPAGIYVARAVVREPGTAGRRLGTITAKLGVVR